jgi:hypothetical protein
MRSRIVSFQPGVGNLKKSARDYIHGTERFSVPYFETLIDGYESLRDSYHKDSWELALDFWDPRSSRETAAWRDSMSGMRVGFDGLMELLEIHPARVRNMIQSAEAMTLNQAPKIIASALSPKMQRLARIFEIASNSEWQRDTTMMDTLRMCHRDAWMTGFAFALNGYWTRSFGRERSERRARAKLAARFHGNPLSDQLAAVITQEEELEDSINMQEKVLTFEDDDRIYNQGICTKRVSPFMVVFDPDAASIPEANWIGRAILADHDAVMRDPNIDNAEDIPTMAVKDIAGFQSGMQRLGMPTSLSWHDAKGPYRYCVLYEIFYRNDEDKWDMLVMAKGLDRELRLEKNVYAMGNPYSMLSWNSHGDSMFATSDFDDVKTLLLAERNALKRFHDGVMRSLQDVNILDKEIFPKAVDTEFITTPGLGLLGYAEGSPIGKRLADGHLQIHNAPVTGECIQYLQMLDKYFQIASGLGPNQVGMPMKSETSATESANVENWVKLRGGVKYAAMDTFVADLSRKRIQLMAQFRDYDTIGDLCGPEAAAEWAKEDFTDGDIQNGLLIKVEQGSMQPRNDAQRAQTAQQFLQLSQIPALAPLINPVAALKMYAEANGVMDGSDLLVNVAPSDVQKAAIQMALMQAGGGGAPGGPQGAPPQGLTPPGQPSQNGEAGGEAA